MRKFKILSMTHKTVIMRKHKYLNKPLNVGLMRNIRLKYYNLFSVPKIHMMIIGKISFGWAVPTLWNSLPNTLRRIRSHRQFKRSYDFVVDNLINLYIFFFIYTLHL